MKIEQQDVFNIISKALEKQQEVLVLIAGPTCSGKSTLARNIERYFIRHGNYKTTIIEQDSYFKDIKDCLQTFQGVMLDSQRAFKVDEFQSDVIRYLIDGKVNIPNYDISTNTRKSKDIVVSRSRITVIEGLHVVDIFIKASEKISSLSCANGEADFSMTHAMLMLRNSIDIYVDTPIDVCLKRRIQRDVEAIHVSPSSVEEYFKGCIMPQYKREILPQEKIASLCVSMEEV